MSLQELNPNTAQTFGSEVFVRTTRAEIENPNDMHGNNCLHRVVNPERQCDVAESWIRSIAFESMKMAGDE
jgi:hypothetical protein